MVYVKKRTPSKEGATGVHYVDLGGQYCGIFDLGKETKTWAVYMLIHVNTRYYTLLMPSFMSEITGR